MTRTNGRDPWYLERLDRATHIPPGPGWNQQFLDNLAAEGLKLVRWRGASLPHNAPIMAPLPCSGQAVGWTRNSLVVEADDDTPW